jgi:ribosomal protein S18 acetylase RimI-like enzyme
VDLRAHPERFVEHRCLLGIGVDEKYRRLGVGRALLAHATQWALESTEIEWIDLQVLSGNESALRLYTAAEFVKISEVPDMFRMDGQSFALITMTKRIRTRAS